MTRIAFTLSSVAALILACGGETQPTDAGSDATTSDVSVQDAPIDAPKNDANTVDGSGEAGNCGGGCALFSYYCEQGQYPACTCLSLSASQPTPVCDAGETSCFVDPCSNKTATCVSNTCVAK